MDTKDVIFELRTKNGLSQDELAQKVFVTRQAVSRWENGDTVPNTETLKLLSKFFNVLINTLLGSPDKLICQCCGMPLDDGIISREKDGSLNERYCKWCYADGEYMYDVDFKCWFFGHWHADDYFKIPMRGKTKKFRALLFDVVNIKEYEEVKNDEY